MVALSFRRNVDLSAENPRNWLETPRENIEEIRKLQAFPQTENGNTSTNQS